MGRTLPFADHPINRIQELLPWNLDADLVSREMAV
jgi:hypothetical protein